MRIIKVTIDNFRNIEHAEYNLDRINLFTGPNQTGKTNSILAIYWAICDFLMDGSSDYPSLKPLQALKATVSVELEFAEFKLMKTYKEHWTKTRGSDELIMTGHDTEYWIDGVKVSITEAKKQLADKFGITGNDTGKFDLLRAVVDPYYIGKQVDWKILRGFIISLCGDVSPDEIFRNNPKLEEIESRLKTDRYDTSISMKYFKQQAKKDNDEMNAIDQKILGLQDIKDPSEEDYEAARKALSDIDRRRANVSAGNRNELSSQYMNDLRVLQGNLAESKAADIQLANDMNAEIDDKIRKITDEYHDASDAYSKIINDTQVSEREIMGIKGKIDNLNYQVKTLEQSKESLYQEYDRLVGFKLPEESKCPNCGYVLNQDSLDAAKKENEEALKDCIDRGQKVALDIYNCKEKIKELEEDLAHAELSNTGLHDTAYVMKKKSDQILGQQYELQKAKVKPIKSSKTQDIETQIIDLNNKISLAIAEERKSGANLDGLMKMFDEEAIPYNQTIRQHESFLEAQKHIKSFEKDKQAVQQDLVACERKMILITAYTEERLKLFSDHISTVFGSKLKFQLIEQNIKEGSWNEVCIPMIVGKNTPYLDGSGSEQIITGIYMAECIKKTMHIPDLPYIFDECDKLDGAHLAAIETDSQIISTIVNDRDYKKVTLVSRA